MLSRLNLAGQGRAREPRTFPLLSRVSSVSAKPTSARMTNATVIPATLRTHRTPPTRLWARNQVSTNCRDLAGRCRQQRSYMILQGHT